MKVPVMDATQAPLPQMLGAGLHDPSSSQGEGKLQSRHGGPGSHPCSAGMGRGAHRGRERQGQPSLPCRWLRGSLGGCLSLPVASLGHPASAHCCRAGLSRLAAAAGRQMQSCESGGSLI